MSKHKTKPEQTREELLGEIRELRENLAEAISDLRDEGDCAEALRLEMYAIRQKIADGMVRTAQVNHLLEAIAQNMAVLATITGVNAEKGPQ